MRISDWRSDGCSSDLPAGDGDGERDQAARVQSGAVEDDRQQGGVAEHARLREVETERVLKWSVDQRRKEQRRHVGEHERGQDLVHAEAGLQEGRHRRIGHRSEEHTSELQSLMRISYAVFCLKKKTNK